MIRTSQTDLRAETLSELHELERWRQPWAQLAARSSRPASQPGWMIPWWHHARTAGAILRMVVVLEKNVLVGVGPFFLDQAHCGTTCARLLAAPASYRTEPLAAPGHEATVAASIAGALARSRPRPSILHLEAVPSDSVWPSALAHGWPGRGPAWTFAEKTESAPTLSLTGQSFQEWFASKSRNFRQQMRRAQRQLDRAGAQVRVVEDVAHLRRALADLCRLHHARWDWRGGPGVVLDDRMKRMLQEAAEELLPSGGLRIVEIELAGRAVSSHLFIAAGGEVSYWLGGFDDAWASQHPSMVALLAAIKDAWSREGRRFDLNGGAQPYKYRFSNAEDTLAWWTIVPRDTGYAATRLRLVPAQTYRFISRRLPTPVKDRLWRVITTISLKLDRSSARR